MTLEQKKQELRNRLNKHCPELLELKFSLLCSRIELWVKSKILLVNTVISKYSMKWSVTLFRRALQKDNTFVGVNVVRKLSYLLAILSRVTQNRAVAIYLKQFRKNEQSMVTQEELKSIGFGKILTPESITLTVPTTITMVDVEFPSVSDGGTSPNSWKIWAFHSMNTSKNTGRMILQSNGST